MDISVSLTPELIGLIQARVDSGRYTSTSEVVRDALRLLERLDQRETERFEWLRHSWQEGIESGSAGPMDFTELRATARRHLPAAGKK